MTEVKWTDGKKTVYCNDFCSLPCTTENAGDCFSDTDALTVCNDKSEKYPVNITINDEETIEKSHLRIQLKNSMSLEVNCIIPSDSKGTDATREYIKNLLSPLTSYAKGMADAFINLWGLLAGNFEDNWLVIDSNLIKSRGSGTDCTTSWGNLLNHDSLENLVIKKNNTIYIRTGSYNFIDKIKKLDTQVLSEKVFEEQYGK
jgi:hypothetical protein